MENKDLIEWLRNWIHDEMISVRREDNPTYVAMALECRFSGLIAYDSQTMGGTVRYTLTDAGKRAIDTDTGDGGSDVCNHDWHEQSELYQDSGYSWSVGDPEGTKYRVYHCFNCHKTRYERTPMPQPQTKTNKAYSLRRYTGSKEGYAVKGDWEVVRNADDTVLMEGNDELSLGRVVAVLNSESSIKEARDLQFEQKYSSADSSMKNAQVILDHYITD